eukprot:scaffold2217_cov132-Isochrysis_galbana.AAC.7
MQPAIMRMGRNAHHNAQLLVEAVELRRISVPKAAYGGCPFSAVRRPVQHMQQLMPHAQPAVNIMVGGCEKTLASRTRPQQRCTGGGARAGGGTQVRATRHTRGPAAAATALPRETIKAVSAHTPSV